MKKVYYKLIDINEYEELIRKSLELETYKNKIDKLLVDEAVYLSNQYEPSHYDVNLFERVRKEYIFLNSKYQDLFYLEEHLKDINSKLEKENIELKKIINIVEGKLLEICEFIDKEMRKE